MTDNPSNFFRSTDIGELLLFGGEDVRERAAIALIRSLTKARQAALVSELGLMNSRTVPNPSLFTECNYAGLLPTLNEAERVLLSLAILSARENSEGSSFKVRPAFKSREVSNFLKDVEKIKAPENMTSAFSKLMAREPRLVTRSEIGDEFQKEYNITDDGLVEASQLLAKASV